MSEPVGNLKISNSKCYNFDTIALLQNVLLNWIFQSKKKTAIGYANSVFTAWLFRFF